MKSSLEIPLTGRVPTRGHAPKLVWFNGENSYGKNPYGKPLYRIIWSKSRTYLLGGCWGDNGAIEYRHAPYYGTKEEWVLEKWITAQEFGGSKQEWELSQLDQALAQHGMAVYTMGPYPANGWYEHVYSYPQDADPDIQAIAQIIEYGKEHYTFQQIKTAINLWHEQKRKEWEQKVMDGMEDAMPAFGNVATNLSSSKPTMDTAGLSNPHELKEAIRKYKGLPSEEKKIFVDLPQRGVSMGRRIISTEE